MRYGPGSSGFWGLGFLLKGFGRLIAAKLGGVLDEKDCEDEKMLMGEIGFGGFLNQLSNGLLKLIDAIGVWLCEKEIES